MLINFVQYVLNFCSLVYGNIMQLANNVLSLTPNLITMDIGDFLKNAFASVSFDNNPFVMLYTELFGSGFDVEIANILGPVLGILNGIFSVVLVLLQALLSFVGLSLPLNNTLLVLVYLGTSIGSFLIVLKVFSKIARILKDLFNPVN